MGKAYTPSWDNLQAGAVGGEALRPGDLLHLQAWYL